MARVYLGLGSNLGDSEAHLRRAIQALGAAGIAVLQVSGFIRTKPYGVLDQPDFLNAVCLVETALEPKELLGRLKGLEKELGREQTRRWGPRVIDLDILLYNEEKISCVDLTVPHADMLNRLFVLQPLAEIAPALLHPVSNRTIAEHLAELEKRSK